eukprot:Rhum_TRINITY_DN14753_c12_g1::Rhum_TRINITY_DN14753_c12_g1_i1::g.118478::m.118478
MGNCGATGDARGPAGRSKDDGGVRCDKCDGRHLSADCTVYPKDREEHPDAQKAAAQPKKQKQDVTISSLSASFKKHPADNHCLYHALCFGFKHPVKHTELRAQLARWVLSNLNTVCISGRPMVQYLAGEYPNDTPQEYAALMESSTRWGGMPELTGCAILHQTNIRVWERESRQLARYKLISVFSPHPEFVRQRPGSDEDDSGRGSNSSSSDVERSTEGSSPKKALPSGSAPSPRLEDNVNETIDLVYNRKLCHYDSLIIPQSHALGRPQPVCRKFPSDHNYSVARDSSTDSSSCAESSSLQDR